MPISSEELTARLKKVEREFKVHSQQEQVVFKHNTPGAICLIRTFYSPAIPHSRGMNPIDAIRTALSGRYGDDWDIEEVVTHPSGSAEILRTICRNRTLTGFEYIGFDPKFVRHMISVKAIDDIQASTALMKIMHELKK